MRCRLCDKVYSGEDWEVHPLTGDFEILCAGCRKATDKMERNEEYDDVEAITEINSLFPATRTGHDD